MDYQRNIPRYQEARFAEVSDIVTYFTIVISVLSVLVLVTFAILMMNFMIMIVKNLRQLNRDQ